MPKPPKLPEVNFAGTSDALGFRFQVLSEAQGSLAPNWKPPRPPQAWATKASASSEGSLCQEVLKCMLPEPKGCGDLAQSAGASQPAFWRKAKALSDTS